MFFEVIYCSIFEYLLVTDAKDIKLLSLVLTYFGIVKINNQRMLYLYYLIQLYNAFYITQLYKQLQVNSKYSAYISEFINYIIRCSKISENKANASAFLNELDSSFALKLDFNLNTVVKSC